MRRHGSVRVAAAQYPLARLPDLGAVQDKLSRWVAEAADNGAELLVFPEYAAMELSAASGVLAASDVASSLEAVAGALPQIDAVHAELARRHRVHILAASGPRRRADGRFVNAARLITPQGRAGVQEKRIMTPFERDWDIAPGQASRVFETELGAIGIAVCYDSEFPVLVRAQAEAGADLILIPSCTERLSGAYRIRIAALARALENSCAMVVSPTVGDAPWCPAADINVGMAGVYAPAEADLSDTGVLAEGVLNHPGWVFAEIDRGRLSSVRSGGEMRNAADWAMQPGVSPVAQHVERVSLI